LWCTERRLKRREQLLHQFNANPIHINLILIHPKSIPYPTLTTPLTLLSAFEMDEEDGARARDGRLNEDTLVRLQHNDPDITYLVLDAATWIKGAGRTIADSRVLRRIYIDVRNDDEDHKWLHELCLGLAFHNRAIDSLSLWWRTCTYDI
jgi:hypothetical protein